MDIHKLSKALDALFLDMEKMPPLGEAVDAWVATRERVHWLAECAAAISADWQASVHEEDRKAANLG